MSAQVIDNELVHALAVRSCGARCQVLPGSHMIPCWLPQYLVATFPFQCAELVKDLPILAQSSGQVPYGPKELFVICARFLPRPTKHHPSPFGALKVDPMKIPKTWLVCTDCRSIFVKSPAYVYHFFCFVISSNPTCIIIASFYSHMLPHILTIQIYYN